MIEWLSGPEAAKDLVVIGLSLGGLFSFWLLYKALTGILAVLAEIINEQRR